jgi:hypothetical protein
MFAMTLVPVAIKSHYLTIHRVRGTLRTATLVAGGGAMLEISGAAVGASYGDLIGMGIGLLAAMLLEVAVMLPTVYRAIISPRGPASVSTGDQR